MKIKISKFLQDGFDKIKFIYRSENKLFRVLNSMYGALLFYMLIFIKLNYVNRTIEIYEKLGISFTRGPLLWHSLIYFYGLFIFILILILPLLTYVLMKKDGALARCLITMAIFGLFYIQVWLSGKIDLSMVYGLCIGGLLGISEGIWSVSLEPEFLKKTSIKPNVKVEMMKFEYQKWWNGLMLFVTFIISTIISGILVWLFSTPPGGEEVLRELNSKQAFFIIFGTIPGIASVIWNIIKRVNYIHDKMGEIK